MDTALAANACVLQAITAMTVLSKLAFPVHRWLTTTLLQMTAMNVQLGARAALLLLIMLWRAAPASTDGNCSQQFQMATKCLRQKGGTIIHQAAIISTPGSGFLKIQTVQMELT
jgi:hypothetical protein